MSFSQQVKAEISRRAWNSPCCATALCYGICCFARVFGGRGLEMHTESGPVAQWAKGVFSRAGISGKVFVRGERQKSYLFTVQDPFEIEKLLVLLGHDAGEPALELRRENLLCNDCLAAFTAAAFLCSGTVVHPSKRYNLEFISPRHKMMRGFAALLEERGFSPRLAMRAGSNILYFRASEQIEDMLTFMGAGMSSMEVMRLKVFKDLRNNANRMTNAETANIDKTVASSAQTIKAIHKLEKAGRLELLEEPLQQAARLRIANPEKSLAELVALSEQPTSRSRLSQRFKKLRELAEN